MTAPYLIAGPAVEPVAVAELRLYLRLDGEAEDGLIAALIRAARLRVEALSGQVLVESRFGLALPRLPREGVALPATPVLAVEGVTVDGAALPSSQLTLDRSTDPPRLAVAPPPVANAPDGVVVTWRAGFGTAAGNVPEPLRLAVRRLAARAFEGRGDEGLGDEARPPDAETLVLIAPYRRPRL